MEGDPSLGSPSPQPNQWSQVGKIGGTWLRTGRQVEEARVWRKAARLSPSARQSGLSVSQWKRRRGSWRFAFAWAAFGSAWHSRLQRRTRLSLCLRRNRKAFMRPLRISARAEATFERRRVWQVCASLHSSQKWQFAELGGRNREWWVDWSNGFGWARGASSWPATVKVAVNCAYILRFQNAKLVEPESLNLFGGVELAPKSDIFLVATRAPHHFSLRVACRNRRATLCVLKLFLSHAPRLLNKSPAAINSQSGCVYKLEVHCGSL